ncbi:MAG: hypothetical protein K5856_02890 [Bacteroidaceae bacterium]|nr:hypothetical protein [Bacteroidaceae bacterium]
MMKELGLIVIPALLLFMFLGTLVVLRLVAAPVYFSVLLYVFLLLAYHFNRGDSTFLYSIFGVRHTKMLFLVEYALLSIPFLCLFFYRYEFWAVAIVLLSLVSICFVPHGGLSLRLPTFPFLASGSYEYHRDGRLAIPLFIPLMVAAAMGAYIGNRNLVVTVSMIAASLFSLLLMREWHVEYLFNYKSAARVLQLKLLFALRNVCVVFLPFILCIILVDGSLHQLFMGASYYVGVSLLLFQVEMLFFVNGATHGGNDILSAIAFMVLNAIFYVSLFVPPILFFSIIVAGGLAYYANSVIKKCKL